LVAGGANSTNTNAVAVTLFVVRVYRVRDIRPDVAITASSRDAVRACTVHAVSGAGSIVAFFESSGAEWLVSPNNRVAADSDLARVQAAVTVVGIAVVAAFAGGCVVKAITTNRRGAVNIAGGRVASDRAGVTSLAARGVRMSVATNNSGAVEVTGSRVDSWTCAEVADFDSLNETVTTNDSSAGRRFVYATRRARAVTGTTGAIEVVETVITVCVRSRVFINEAVAVVVFVVVDLNSEVRDNTVEEEVGVGRALEDPPLGLLYVEREVAVADQSAVRIGGSAVSAIGHH
jgi:hypothetical protein